MARPDRPRRSSARATLAHAALALALALAAPLAGCSIPYPVAVAAGPFVIPPSPAKEPLSERGARVQVVPVAPPGCLFLGLATGVGGAPDQYQGIGDRYLQAYQAEAVVALRNAVGEVGGTHTVVDAEVQHSGREGLKDIVLRGPALLCR
jgi:hypothetical protein